MSSVLHAIVSSACELGVDTAATTEKQSQTSPEHTFFHFIYQKQPAIFRSTQNNNNDITDRNSEHRDNSPLRRTLGMGWEDISALLHHCRREHATTDTSPPLFFQSGKPIADPYSLYASNPHAAYIDGCSIIVNHADLHHLTIAQLCEDLQQSFREFFVIFELVPLFALFCPTHSWHFDFQYTNSPCLCQCILDSTVFACSRRSRR